MSRHLDSDGRPQMVDVSAKSVTTRTAAASAMLSCNRQAFDNAVGGTAKKGDVMRIAETAGIMAAKQTSMLIPLCHNLALHAVTVRITPHDEGAEGGRFEITAQAVTKAETGVEMEALTAAAVASLTLYDMLKGDDKMMIISQIRLDEKTGGKSGEFKR